MAPASPIVRTERSLTCTQVFVDGVYVGYVWHAWLHEVRWEMGFGGRVDPALGGRWYTYSPLSDLRPYRNAGYATEDDAVAAIVAEAV